MELRNEENTTRLIRPILLLLLALVAVGCISNYSHYSPEVARQIEDCKKLPDMKTEGGGTS